MDFEAVDDLVVGRDLVRSAKHSTGAGVLFLIVFVLRVPTVFGPLPPVAERHTAVVLFAGFALAAATAYLNDGLLVSVVAAAALTLGFYLPYVFGQLRPNRTALVAIGLGVGYALLLGALGFLLGAGGRRLRARLG
jgi:hypothetical protein